MIITIDGPTASGKSTIARILAHDLGYYYLYSGLLYRALGYLLVQEYLYTEEDLAYPEPAHLEILLHPANFIYTYAATTGARIFFKGVDITPRLKSPEVDRYSCLVSAQPLARAHILAFQRNLAAHHCVVADGRDCGTVVFPHAACKFFLTAQPAVRAARWRKDQFAAGKMLGEQESVAALLFRDERDTEREHSPLVIAPDAIVIDNSQLDLQQTVEEFKKFIAQKIVIYKNNEQELQ